MAKYTPKRINNYSNQRSIIHKHAKSKRLKKPPQQSDQNMEATKVNDIMDQLDKTDGNVHGHNTSINHFAPIFG